MVDDLNLGNQLCFALYATSHAMTRAYAPMLAPLGLTYPQYVVLLILWENDGLSVNEIAARLALDAGTVTPLLRRMEHSGLLTRRRSEADERRVEVRLTSQGDGLRGPVARARASVLKKSGLSAQGGAALREQLRQLFDSLTVEDGLSTASSTKKKRKRK
jgi:MarR family transcriptional regulator, organic hydroperoxide resistance regulator